MYTIGEKIKGLRKSAGISQEKLSEKLDISRNTVSNWENNTTSPSGEFLEKLCDIFSVEISYFFEEEVCAAEEEFKRNKMPAMQKLKIAIIVSGVLTALFIIFFATVFAIAISDSPMEGYSETVSATAFNFHAIFYSFITIVSISIICFFTLLITYNLLRKKRQMHNNLCNENEQIVQT